MNLLFFDDYKRSHLFPLTLTRPAAQLRIGILTIQEKWERALKSDGSSYLTADYLHAKYPKKVAAENWLINGRICPSASLLKELKTLATGELLMHNDTIIAAKLSADAVHAIHTNDGVIWNATLDALPQRACTSTDFTVIERAWHLFQHNAHELKLDFKAVTQRRKSQPLSATNTLIGDVSQLFIEQGATVECAVLNTTAGPIYVGAHAEIMEGSLVRGGLAMCAHSALKLGAKIYGATTLGPYCKVGGEVNNSILIGYSNKGHDGFLGNSVLGEWCNLGADTNNSNLKNNYAEVKVWDYDTQRFVPTGLQFCGLIMGDHSKSGINTMFNTGTVVGVSANLFGAGFPRNCVPSFAWGGAQSMTAFALPKAYEVAESMMSRRGVAFTEADKYIFSRVAELDGFK